MNFLGMGPGELVLIAVLGLIVFGPGKLPEIAGQVGKAVRDFRQSTQDVRNEFQRSFSLEEPPAPEAPPAALPVAEAPSVVSEPIVASPPPVTEPPLADTSSWPWESGSAAPATAVEPAAAASQADSIWVWDAPEPDTAPVEAASADSDNPWAWDESPAGPAPSALSPAPVDQEPSTPDAAADAVATPRQTEAVAASQNTHGSSSEGTSAPA